MTRSTPSRHVRRTRRFAVRTRTSSAGRVAATSLLSKLSLESLPRSVLMLLEMRAALELVTSAALLPTLLRAPKGDGQPVLLLPGLGTGDTSLEPMRLFLKSRGYLVETWGLGRNKGLTRKFSKILEEKIRFLHYKHGRRVSIVGWSLGGVFAFYAAHVAPECVRSVIALGSPLRVDPDAPPVPGGMAMYRALADPFGPATHQARARSRALRGPPPVPSTCIYSRTDGIVMPEHATLDGDPRTHENICVPGSHMGLAVNGYVMWIVADRLAQPEGAWRPLDASRVAAPLRWASSVRT